MASDDLRTKIAAVLAGHQIETRPFTFRCSCLPDAWLASRSDCDLHLADAVIAELGLAQLEWTADE